MWMTEYVFEIKKALRDQHHITPTRMVGDEPLFDNLPDGEYPVVIAGELDRVVVKDGRFLCCRTKEPRPEASKGKRYEHWCTNSDGNPLCLGWSNKPDAFAKCVDLWPGKSNHRAIDLEPSTQNKDFAAPKQHGAA